MGLCLLSPPCLSSPILETVRGALGCAILQVRHGPQAAVLPFEMEEPADRSGCRATPGTRCLATIQYVFWICFRIYNNLPEVKKKKEEQKKRVILQSNRLRAEVFKKVMAWPPAGVTRVWHADADSELDVFVSYFPSNYWTSSFKGMPSNRSLPC